MVQDGDELRVSFEHALIVHDEQVCCRLNSQKVDDVAIDQVKMLGERWPTNHLFMQHDEIRVAGYEWDNVGKGSRSRLATAGDLLSTNINRVSGRLRRDLRGCQLYVWSDMFDPHHNARDSYYLTRKTMKGSWKGLSREVVIVNWNQEHSKESLEWFASRKHEQVISAYYDEDVDANFQKWHKASQGIDGIRGWMYTTWEKNYDDLEHFAELVRSNKP